MERVGFVEIKNIRSGGDSRKAGARCSLEPSSELKLIIWSADYASSQRVFMFLRKIDNINHIKIKKIFFIWKNTVGKVKGPVKNQEIYMMVKGLISIINSS